MEQSSTCWFTFQIAAIASWGPTWNLGDKGVSTSKWENANQMQRRGVLVIYGMVPLLPKPSAQLQFSACFADMIPAGNIPTQPEVLSHAGTRWQKRTDATFVANPLGGWGGRLQACYIYTSSSASRHRISRLEYSNKWKAPRLTVEHESTLLLGDFLITDLTHICRSKRNTRQRKWRKLTIFPSP